MDAPTPFRRICLRCLRPIQGYGFTTLYGYLYVTAPGPTLDGTLYQLKVHSCGECVHIRCPRPGAGPREVFHETSAESAPVRPSRRNTRVGPGIFLQPNGRYVARFNNTRVGTYNTKGRAETARQQYIDRRART